MEMGPVNGQTGNSYGAPPAQDPNAILNKCREIDSGIQELRRDFGQIRSLQQAAIEDPDISRGTAKLDAKVTEVVNLYRSLVDRIKKVKQQKESGDPRNRPQVERVNRNLTAAINEYQELDREFRQKVRDQKARQLRIVKPDASEQEVRAAVEDPNNDQIFSQAVSIIFCCFGFRTLTETSACKQQSTRAIAIHTAGCK